jgi:FkbM family methyltransferase
MAFSNVKNILKMRSPVSSYKLLLIAAASSRPRLRELCHMLLQPFVKQGEVSLRYRCYNRFLQTFVRMSDIESDLLGMLELSVHDTYNLGRDLSFQPDLVIDGGGNIGLFTLRAAASTSSASSSSVRFVICEPLPRNVEQIQKHLDINRVQAELIEGCLGGTRRTIPFYCREAIHSSFDPEKPYTRVMDMPVYLLEDVIGSYPATRILIKLDIEGMEIEALDSFVPTERRPVYIVGELHDFSLNAPLLERVFSDNGWTLEYCSIAGNNAIFRACSPAALALLPSMPRSSS